MRHFDQLTQMGEPTGHLQLPYWDIVYTRKDETRVELGRVTQITGEVDIHTNSGGVRFVASVMHKEELRVIDDKATYEAAVNALKVRHGIAVPGVYYVGKDQGNHVVAISFWKYTVTSHHLTAKVYRCVLEKNGAEHQQLIPEGEWGCVQQ